MSDAFTKAAGPKGKYLKFKNVGDTFTIGVTGIEERQSRTYREGGLGDLEFYPSGDPIMEQVISGVELDEDYEAGEEVVLLVNKKLLRKRIGLAIKEAGGDMLEEGSIITVTYIGYGPKAKGQTFPPKDFAVEYELPEPEED